MCVCVHSNINRAKKSKMLFRHPIKNILHLVNVIDVSAMNMCYQKKKIFNMSNFTVNLFHNVAIFA